MAEAILKPLEEYCEKFQDRFREVCKQTFSDLASDANVDVDVNRITCRKLYSTQNRLASLNKKDRWLKIIKRAIFVSAGIGLILCVIEYRQHNYLYLLLIGSVIVAVIAFYLFIIMPKRKKLNDHINLLKSTIDELNSKAWEQMTPLNNLFDWDTLVRMITQTVPLIEFDPYFTTRRLEDLRKTYGWDDSFNQERSVVYSHSGQINGNPFIICRTRKMEMGSKTYYGSLEIKWTESELGPDGKRHTIYRSETLKASITADYPEYFEKTRLIYANTAAPNLVFHRKQSGLANKTRSLKYKRTLHSLKKKAQDLRHSDFALMTNEDFEVAFDTRDRNNNQQYSLLFTPLAQENMLELLKDSSVAYGDDFDFNKEKMINVIFSNHVQNLNLDMNPGYYRGFDYEKIEETFKTVNEKLFHSIYFCFAPLLCVPTYQQVRPADKIYGRDVPRQSSFWEHESLANFWGVEHFKHPDCVTNCILKTERTANVEDGSTIKVYAYGYRKVERVAYVPKRGGDGYMHDVPVHWDEYIPVTGNGTITLADDNAYADGGNMPVSQRDRLTHMGEFLQKTNLTVYRRHIASKI